MTHRRFDLALHLDVARHGSLQKALYEGLRREMLEGRLAGSVPSTRALAEQLDVARGTVVAAYEQLAAEGYLTTVRGSGTRVSAELPDGWLSAPAPARDRGRARGPSRLDLSRWGRSVVSPFPVETRRPPRPFRPHAPALDAFPDELFARLVTHEARSGDRLREASDVRGHRGLRVALRDHLQTSRGVVCHPDAIVIVPSAQQALDLLARLVLDPGDEAWLEDPGYGGARAVLEAAGARVVPVPVDARGIDVAKGVRRAPNARLAFVTPGHQAPLGVTMAIERRTALLDWAAARSALIVEDDYDSEYRYEGRPVPVLQGLDRFGVVAHVGTFSKTLLPSLRLAYVVLPEALVDPFLAAKGIVDRYTPPFLQGVLARFVAEGHFARHLRKMRALYASRRAALLDALSGLDVVGANAGLDLVVRLPRGADDVALRASLSSVGVEVATLSTEWAKPGGDPGLVLGFAPYSEARLARAAALLRRVARI